MMTESLNILLIEDNLIEIMKMKRALAFLESKHQIKEAKDAEQALQILEAKAFFPDLILLDLNMPKISGIEFLNILKNNAEYRHIPVVILTTSDNQKDLLECYKIGISGYVLKPLKYDEYVSKIKSVLEYWSTNELKKA